MTIFEQQQARKQQARDRADMQPIDWTAKRNALLASGAVDDRQVSRISDLPKRNAALYYAVGLRPIREPEQYKRQLCWPLDTLEGAIEVPYGPVAKERGLV